MTAILFLTFFVLLLLGVPVVFCMIISSLAALLYLGVDPIMVGLEMSRSMTSFYPFIAVPLFILAGDLMNKGGLSQKITNFCCALVGHRRGGMAMVTTLSCQMFGAVSGASSATCAAIGGVMIPAMTRQGYQRSFATALSACSGTTGALIPPSMVLLLYGVIANVSIEKLFMAGVIPGILFGLGLMVVSYLYAGRQKVPIAPKAGFMELLKSAGDAIFAIILILIIFGGIMGGIFTATEAAAVSVIYALLVGLFVYRKIKLRDLSAIFVNAGKTATVLSFLLCAAMLFQWVLTLGYLPQILAKGLLGGCEGMLEPFRDSLSPGTFFVLHKVLVLIVLNISLLIVGMFLDAGAALLIVTPVLLPVGAALGIDEVQFGVIVVTNLIIGLVTPPVGTTLFVASGVGRVRMAEMIPHVLKFLIPMFVVQILVTFVPWTTIALPSLYQWIKS